MMLAYLSAPPLDMQFRTYNTDSTILILPTNTQFNFTRCAAHFHEMQFNLARMQTSARDVAQPLHSVQLNPFTRCTAHFHEMPDPQLTSPSYVLQTCSSTFFPLVSHSPYSFLNLYEKYSSFIFNTFSRVGQWCRCQITYNQKEKKMGQMKKIF